MTGHDVEGLVECAEDRDRRRENGRLSVLGELEVLFRPFEAQPREILPKRLVGGLEDRAGSVGCIESVATHADLLASLAWENERDLAHRERP
jgi:hypothetical protein